MAISEADLAMAATTNETALVAVDPVSDDALTYQTITETANDLISSFIERIPYFVAAVIVIIIFWLLSIVFKKALDTAGIDMPFPVRTLDLSDPSVKAIAKQIHEQQAAHVDSLGVD